MVMDISGLWISKSDSWFEILWTILDFIDAGIVHIFGKRSSVFAKKGIRRRRSVRKYGVCAYFYGVGIQTKLLLQHRVITTNN